jgi:hypothetical protein
MAVTDFEKQLSDLINTHNKENGSNTPDFILAKYMATCLEAFNEAVRARERWYGSVFKPGRDPAGQPTE